MTLYRRQRSRKSTEKEMQKGKMVSEEALQIAEKRKDRREMQRKKRKDIRIWMQSSKELQREIRKPSSVINAKKWWCHSIQLYRCIIIYQTIFYKNHLVCFNFFIKNNDMMNILLYICTSMHEEWILQSRIAGWKDICIWNLDINCQIAFKKIHSNLPSQQIYESVRHCYCANLKVKISISLKF